MSDDPSPLHEGEIALQRRAGVHERMLPMARRVIRDFMPDQHREFFAQLPTLVVGGFDAELRPAATMLCGEPGFVHAPDPRSLHIELHGAAADDPVLPTLAPGSRLGVLGLQPQTRRRNRMNGIVVARDARHVAVAVEQSFGNCPQYIQAREPRARPGVAAASRRGGALLDAALVALVERADTFFIASAAAPPGGLGGPTRGVDVSHRGGRPGFVRCAAVDGRSVLTVPDYAGNNLFMTLGNLALNPACGLLFVDYDSGDLLHVRARGVVLWDDARVRPLPGAQRVLELTVEASLWRPAALPLRWTPPEFPAATPAAVSDRA